MNTRVINQDGLELIKTAEGFRARAYLCPAGVPTIGYGHTRGVTRADVERGRTITEVEASVMLRSDLAEAEGAVTRLVRVPLEDCEFAALVSFTFNLGAKALEESTLLWLINNGYKRDAMMQFQRWCKANGKILQGLVRRRAAEQALFRGEDWRPVWEQL